MNAVVTGGNGFLGRSICRQLTERGHRVIGLQRSEVDPVSQVPGVEYVSGDIADASLLDQVLSGVDVVFHTAAKAGVWGAESDYRKTNVEGTQGILEACLRNGVGRLIHTSTPSVVFTGQAISGGDESMPYGANWLCHYAKTKAEAERLVLDSRHLKSVQVVALRPHLIWGEGDPHLVPRLVSRARAGRLMQVGDGKNSVDITHVDNAAYAHLCALEALESDPTRVNGRAFFISDGDPVNLWDWIRDLLMALDLDAPKRRVSMRFAYRMGGALEWLYRTFGLRGEPPMTRFVAVELAKDHFFDISAARDFLGYVPVVKMEDGMGRMVAAMKANNPR